MKKQFITEAKRLQKLAGIITESQLLKEENFVDGDYVDENRIIKFFKDTMISKGYNFPEDFWLDMRENADFTIEDDGEYRDREYFENFDEDNALEEVTDYLEALLDYYRDVPEDLPYLQGINSIEDFRRN
jgi:hypothetical protein